MTDQHPITPPPELFAQCYEEAERNLQASFPLKFAISHAIRTAYAAGHAAGADQELEACCEYLTRCAAWEPEDVAEFFDHRRPKPPSLKEQALGALGRFNTNAHTRADEMTQDFDAIRRAIEQLPD